MKTLPTIALIVIALLTSTAASAQCVQFDDIDHCPIGDATLKLSADGSRLIAKNLGAGGTDGVTSLLDSATLWRAALTIPNASTGDNAVFTAVTDGFAASTASFRIVGDDLEGRTVFTGGAGTYHLQVLNDGDEVASQGGQSSSSSFTIRGIPPHIPPPPDFPPIIIFKNRLGVCSWNLRFDAPITVSVGGVAVGTGDEVILTEDFSGGGHYVYTRFEEMQIQSNGHSIVVEDELEVSNGL